jgi:hypothetical protein
MIVWNVLGHTKLGFEQSWATPITAVLTAIAVSMLLDWIDARAKIAKSDLQEAWAAFSIFFRLPDSRICLRHVALPE